MALPEPYYEDEAVTIYHGDCREILPHLPKVDAVVTDPPYGIGWVPRVNHREDNHIWVDNKAFDPRPFMIADRHLFWGANYFCRLLPHSEAWFLWLKRPASFDNCVKTFAPCEMAWIDFKGKQRVNHHVWDGGLRAGDTSNRDFLHPAQKPLEVMRWCVRESKADLIFDPFMGSGTTLRAAKDLGRKAIGIEIEEKYCEIAAKRMAQEVLPL